MACVALRAANQRSLLPNLCCATRPARPTTRGAPRLLLELLVQRKDYVNRGIDFDRFSVESGRAVLPLTHCIKSCLYQKGMPRQHFELLHRTVFRNDRVQAHGAGDARLPRQWRILWLHTIHEHGGLHSAALADALLRRLRGRWCTTHSTNPPSD